MGKERKPKKVYKDKHEAFLCVVTPRVGKALRAIALIGNQAGVAYAPTKAEVAEMFKAIRAKVDETEKCYTEGITQASGFSFAGK